MRTRYRQRGSFVLLSRLGGCGDFLANAYVWTVVDKKSSSFLPLKCHGSVWLKYGRCSLAKVLLVVGSSQSFVQDELWQIGSRQLDSY